MGRKTEVEVFQHAELCPSPSPCWYLHWDVSHPREDHLWAVQYGGTCRVCTKIMVYVTNRLHVQKSHRHTFNPALPMCILFSAVSPTCSQHQRLALHQLFLHLLGLHNSWLVPKIASAGRTHTLGNKEQLFFVLPLSSRRVKSIFFHHWYISPRAAGGLQASNANTGAFHSAAFQWVITKISY